MGVESRLCKKEAFEMPEILAKWGKKADFAKKKLLKYSFHRKYSRITRSIVSIVRGVFWVS